MPYKIEGTTNTNGELVILKEDDWSVEKTANIDSSQAYSVNALASGTKVVFAKRPGGEIVSYGNVQAIPGALYDRELGNALMVNADDSQYFTKTFSGGGQSSRQMIFSAWLKRGNINTTQWIYGALNTGTRDAIYITAQNTLYIYLNNGGSGEYLSTPLFRDVTGWFNLVVAFDTTNSTAGDRIRAWVNGVEISDWSTETAPALNYDFYLNQANAHGLLGRDDGSIRWDGYAAEIISLDGETHEDPPSLFGELANGVWVPKGSLAGLSYGTNGFLLDFSDSGDLGNDSSGQGNDFTPVNLSASNQITDEPTNNFATLNYVDGRVGSGMSEGGLRFFNSVGSHEYHRSTLGSISGKWYFEGKAVVGTSSFTYFGLATSDVLIQVESADTSKLVRWVLKTYLADDTSVSDRGSALFDLGGRTPLNTDILMCAYDADNNQAWLGLNGDWYKPNGTTGADPSAGTDPTVTGLPKGMYGMGGGGFSGGIQMNFGNPSFSIVSGNSDDNGYGNFEYAPPTGFLSLCTANMSNPSIEDASEGIYVNTRTVPSYADATVSDVNFDVSAGSLIIIKSINGVDNWHMFDTERGLNKDLYLNSNAAEVTDTNEITAFNTDGYDLDKDGSTNINGWTYIDVVLRKDANYGLDIISYVGNGGTSNSVNHNLGAVPTMIWAKSRDASRSWIVYHSLSNSSPETYYGVLDTNAAFSNANNMWDNTLPTSTQFFLNHYEINSAENCIAYLFADIPGYCKAFSYIGNGNADGPYIPLGFRPIVSFTKRVSVASSWFFGNTSLTGYNPVEDYMYMDFDAIEQHSTPLYDYCSQGIKVVNNGSYINNSSELYIGFAWAEAPGKWSNAR